MSEANQYDPRWGELIAPDIDHLSEEEKIEYWKKTTTGRRLREGQRLRRLEFGRAADGPMDKSKIEIVTIDRK